MWPRAGQNSPGRQRLPAHHRRTHKNTCRVSPLELAALVDVAGDDSPPAAARKLALWATQLAHKDETAPIVSKVLASPDVEF